MRPPATCFTRWLVAFALVAALSSASASRAGQETKALAAPATHEASIAASLTADTLLRHLARGEIAGAYALFIDDIREQLSVEEFAGVWVPLQRLGIWAARWTTVGVDEASPGGSTIELAGVLKTISGDTVDLEATIVRANGAYRMLCLKFKQR